MQELLTYLCFCWSRRDIHEFITLVAISYLQKRGPFLCFVVGHIPCTVHSKSSEIFKMTHKLVSKRIIREKSIMPKNWIIKVNENLPFKLHVWPLPRSSQSMQLLIGQSCVNIRKSKWWSWDFRVFVGDESVVFSVCSSCAARWSNCACDKVLAVRNNKERILEIPPGNIILNCWQEFRHSCTKRLNVLYKYVFKFDSDETAAYTCHIVANGLSQFRALLLCSISEKRNHAH